MESITCIVDSPKGSGGKFVFDPATGYFTLGETLPAGLVFPFDSGFVPGTKAEDGHPLSVVIISEIRTFTGCALDCRLIGGITARQAGRAPGTRRNNCLIVVPDASVMYRNVRRLSQIPAQALQEIERFFIDCESKAGRRFGLMQAAQASKIMREAAANAAPSILIQLLLPRFDNGGRPFPGRLYTSVRKKLTDAFGGVTIYSKAPATGLWKNENAQVVADQMIIFEVMAGRVDKAFWQQYRERLRKQFAQDEIAIRRMAMGPL